MLIAAFKFSNKRVITKSMMHMTVGTKTSDTLIQEAASLFLKNYKDCTIVPTSGGVNNVVQYVTTPTGDKYILRIYNNGGNTPRVKFEHDVLKGLSGTKLAFSIPTFISSHINGLTHSKISSGAEACLCHIIPGTLPKTRGAKDIGRAAGELCTALSKVDKSKLSPCPTPPYYDLYKVHHAVTRDIFYNEMKTDAFKDCREWADLLVKEINEIEETIKKYQDQGLPIQLIHGDLHQDNVLCDENDKVTGLLDFEFTSFDWRAMELAICLSKYAGEGDKAFDLFKEFVIGYSEHGILTRKEVEAIPDLIILRVLSNVVYFVGRAVSGEDKIDSLTTRAKTYYTRVQWLKNNNDRLVQLIDDIMKPKMGKNY